MSNKKVSLVLMLAAALALTGCGGGKEEPETAAPSAPATETTEEPVTEAMSEFSQAEAALEPITPSDYLVKNISDYITLGPLDNLSATQAVYEVTDEMVQERIDDELYMYSEETEVEKAAEGNIVYADLTYSIQGVEDSESEESTFFTIGDADYGEEFDEQMLGAAVNDELSFSISYGDDTWYEEWIDHTVDFTVKVTGVYELVVPEYDDAFVSENTDYASKEEYETAMRESIEEEYAADSYTETVNNLFQAAVEQSVFSGYPEDLYEACKDELISYYGQFVGSSDVAEILDALGLTEEDLDADVLNSVNLRLLISAVCEENHLEVTEEEYVDSVTEDAAAYGYMSAVEYEEESTREALVWYLYENKAAEFLYDHADITSVQADEEDLASEGLLDLGDMEFETEGETSLETELTALEEVVAEPDGE